MQNLAMIYAALTGEQFDAAVGGERTAAAVNEAGLTVDEALDVLQAMAKRGDKITPATLKAALEARAECAVFLADSQDGDGASEGDDNATERSPCATCSGLLR